MIRFFDTVHDYERCLETWVNYVRKQGKRFREHICDREEPGQVWSNQYAVHRGRRRWAAHLDCPRC